MVDSGKSVRTAEYAMTTQVDLEHGLPAYLRILDGKAGSQPLSGSEGTWALYHSGN